jgi:hypothetical protein
MDLRAILHPYLLAIALISCDCGTEPPPPDDGPDTPSPPFVVRCGTILVRSFKAQDAGVWYDDQVLFVRMRPTALTFKLDIVHWS